MLVEGATEVKFVKRVSAQPLSDRGVTATPVSMDGDVTSDRMARELATLFRSFDCVTSFVDFCVWSFGGNIWPRCGQCCPREP